jgi:tetratricopeptide (TPR) repeat protein/TolB-like protein
MSERDHRIGELYEAALKKPIGERVAFVTSRAGDDLDLRQRVESLLAGQLDTALPGYEPAAGAGGVISTGTLIGSYRIDGPLGAGGMGVVYRATDTRLNRPAAIKVLPENLADPEARRRFQREAQMVSSLNHPHIVTVYDAGEYLDRQYLITEYVDGGTLRQWAARPRGWRPIVELLIGVADGIATAHDAGILHRDIKPENILLAKNGYAKLADFGLAKLFEADPFADDALAAMRADGKSSLVGTAAYMSPEQMQGLALDARSDVYSFGLVLYELLSGSRPSADREALRRGGEPEPIPPLGEQVPAELRTIVAKALEPEPADRYQTMRDLVVDLRRLARRSGIETTDTSFGAESVAARTGPALAPRRLVARRIAYGLVIVAALGAGAFLVQHYAHDALTPGPTGKTVAVLPFANDTANADDAYISEGLGDELRNRLMGLPGLSVAARPSSISFRDRDVDLRTVAKNLGVSVLINGSLRRRGETLTVLVEVLNANGFGIGSFRYERPAPELAVMQSEIAMQVSSLLVPGTDHTVTAIAAMPTSEGQSAQMLVTLGRHYEQQVRDDITVDEPKMEKAIDLYRRATVADSTSLAAYSRLAGALLYLGAVDRAKAPLDKALNLAASPDTQATPADLSDTYYTLALYLMRSRSTGIEAAYQRSIELNPDNVDALVSYGQWLLTHQGPAAADKYFRRALDLDRQSLSRYADYGEYLGTIEGTDRLMELANAVESRFPNARGYLALARLYDLMGDFDVAIAWGLKAFRLQPDDAFTKWQIAELYARIGDWDKAKEFDPDSGIGLLLIQRRYNDLIDKAQEAIIDNPNDLDVYYDLAFAYNATGDFASAKRLLQRLGFPEIAVGTEFSTNVDDQALTNYIDALQALGEEADAQDIATRFLAWDVASRQPIFEKAWWVQLQNACKEITLGEVGSGLDMLDRVKNTRGLAWSWFLLDSPCFKRIASEPRYVAVIDRLEERQRLLRERLPATLREHGVADVGASTPGARDAPRAWAGPTAQRIAYGAAALALLAVSAWLLRLRWAALRRR